MAVKISGENFETEVTDVRGTVVVDFYSDSCIPCKRMSPVLARLEEELTDIKLVKININFDAETAEKFNVVSVPTLVIFKNGEERSRITGAVKFDRIIETINEIQ